MKILNYLLVFILLCTSACNKDDDNNCIKDENYFIAEFDEEALEPYWHTGFATSHYTMYNNRNPHNQDDWEIVVGVGNSRYIYMYIIDVNDIGRYSIETGNEADLANFFSKTYLYMVDESYIGHPDLSIFTHFSMGDTGSFEITEYDSTKGILIGTFICMMYSTHNEGEVKEITGEFNINLATHNRDNKPCWL